MSRLSIPIETVTGQTLPDVWERSIVRLWTYGREIPTTFDREGDPPSLDTGMVMVVLDPTGEPRIHRALPGGVEDLHIYCQEVLRGVHDDRIGSSPTAWEYTYHERLYEYTVFEWDRQYGEWDFHERYVDQINDIVEKLVKNPTCRRAQAVTWNVGEDMTAKDPPCLQRVWCRLIPDERGYSLEMHTHWRSRDALKAAFMNMYALTLMQIQIANALNLRLPVRVRVGPYVDISDSYHIYGKDLQDAERFMEMREKRTFEERTWKTMDVAEQFGHGETRLREEEALLRR